MSTLFSDKQNDDLILSLDAFVRSIGVRRLTQHTFSLGAGASISSGVPSAQKWGVVVE